MQEIDSQQTLSREFLIAFSWITPPDDPLPAATFLTLAKTFDDAIRQDSIKPLMILKTDGHMMISFRGKAVYFHEHDPQSGDLFEPVKEIVSSMVASSGGCEEDTAKLQSHIETIYDNTNRHQKLRCG